MTLEEFATSVHMVSVEYNNHLGCYETVEQYYSENPPEEWVSAEERLKAMQTQTVCALHWYPTTPVGGRFLLATTLEACLKKAIDRSDESE